MRATVAQQEGLEEVLTESARQKVGAITFVPPDSPLCKGDALVVNPSAGTYCSAALRRMGLLRRCEMRRNAMHIARMAPMRMILCHCR